MSRLLLFTVLVGALASCKTKPAPTPTPPVVSSHRAALESPPLAEDMDPRDDVIHLRLRAAAKSDPDGHFIYAYNEVNPGPLIRGRVGDQLIVDVENALDARTTIHWHGLKVPFAMDGVAWRGQPIEAGASFRYEYRLPHAGTYWYHPHFNTERQVDGGLYGALIIDDGISPVPDADLVLLFDTETEFDARVDDLPDGLEGRPGHGHGRRQPKWRVNGVASPATYTARGGTVVRARMINVSNAGYLELRWPGIRLIATDQGLLPALQRPESVVLAPGDRAEVEWLIGETGFTVETLPYSINGGPAHGDRTPLIEVAVDDPQPAPDGLAWPFPGGEVTPDPGYYDLLYVFHGSDRTGIWLINGERFPDVTVEEVDFGAEVIIEVRNLSPTEHPFHLHGLHFEVLSVNGTPPPYVQIEDNYNLRIRDRLRVRVVADNAGDWMTHCHILPHADDGMMTVLRVRAP